MTAVIMARRIGVVLIALAVGCAPKTARPKETREVGAAVLMFEDFENGMSDWWVEGGERVWVEDGRLRVKADPDDGDRGNVCTVWYKHELPGDIQIDFDAHCIASGVDANNINFFLCYSDPSGLPLYETRQSRASAAYPLYHGLNGHIVTFLNDNSGQSGRNDDGSMKARIRVRRCPGFKLLSETFDYHCKQGVTYHVTIRKQGAGIRVIIDGREYLSATDDCEPLAGGLIGLRTYHTYLWWDNVKVTAIE